MTKEERKLEKKLERHKVNSVLKEIVDQEKDVEELIITAYQNKNGQGWTKVEIPITKKKI